MTATIQCVASALGEVIETNDEMARTHPEWDVEAITAKTGVRARRKLRPDQTAADLAAEAAAKLFEQHGVDPKSIDFILLCTSAPDYMLPTTACVLQARLGIPTSAGALDFNLGCSGYVYGLSMAKGLIESGQATRILLLTADAYTRYLDHDDRSTWPLFGDAGTATLITDNDGPGKIGVFDFGTDGRGEYNLIRPGTGCRPMEHSAEHGSDALKPGTITMEGMKVFSFAILAVPKTIKRVLDKAGLTLDAIDWVLFHQASGIMLEHLIQKLKLPAEKVPIEFGEVGNTVSSTIPLLVASGMEAGRFEPGQKLLLVGFGVGYSWAAGVIDWQ